MQSKLLDRKLIWQWRIIGTLWLTYCLYYVGRMNLAVALPVIEQEFGWSTVSTGMVSSVFFWVYAFGQLINGSLGDRIPARWFVAIGLLGTAVCNLLFGLSNTLFAMALVWGLNGIFQSTGWGPIVRTASVWTEPHQRNSVSAILGTSFVVGVLVSWWLSGQILSTFQSWQIVFWIPAAILIIQAVLWVASIRNTPQEAGLQLTSGLVQSTAKPLLVDYIRATSEFLRQPYLLLLAVTTLFQGM